MSEIETVRQLLAQMQNMVGDAPSVEELRAGYSQMGGMAPMAPDVSVEQVGLGGVSGLRLTPPTAQSARTILYFHGGGYVIGSPIGHRSMVSHIATHLKAVAYSMDYRMAPEAPFPAAPEDGLAAYSALLDGGAAPDKIIISGDSAGGGLTMATALKIKAAGLPLPAGLMPLSPWANLENNGWTYGFIGDRDPMIQQEGIDGMATTYLNGASAADPLASPVNGDLAGLPPILIQVGSEEALLSDATLLAERAGAHGVAVDLQIWPGQIHVFQYFHGLLSDAHRAFEAMATWSETRWGK